MTAKTVAPESSTSLLVAFDPWIGTAVVHTQSESNPEQAPLHWHALTPASRERVGAALVYVTGLLPGAGRADVGVLVARAQQAMRAAHMQESGETGPPVLVLADLYVRDAEERPRWRQAEEELARIGSGGVLREAALKLVAVGDLAATLLQRRRDLDRALERLARLRAR